MKTGHVTSSYDIAIMSRELLLNHPAITNYTTVYMDTLRDGKSQLVNTNKLIRNYRGATGLKTGSTSIALYNLSASATRDELSLIAVVMKAPTSELRFQNAKKILDYGFKNFSYTKRANKGDVIANINVSKGLQNNVNAIINCDTGILTKKGREGEIVQNIQLEKNILAPVQKDQKLGTIEFKLNEQIVATVDIVAENTVEKQNFSSITSYIYKSWFTLLR